MHTAWGPIQLYASARGLSKIALPRADKPPAPAPTVLTVDRPAQTLDFMNAAIEALQRLLEGNEPPPVPLDRPVGTAFQRAVMQTMARIPRGTAITYSELAQRAGYPGAARAAGTVCRTNPLPLLIPCHRVIAAHGPGGFSSGLAWKHYLLEVEKIAIML